MSARIIRIDREFVTRDACDVTHPAIICSMFRRFQFARQSAEPNG
jgi:hypothetical protein